MRPIVSNDDCGGDKRERQEREGMVDGGTEGVGQERRQMTVMDEKGHTDVPDVHEAPRCTGSHRQVKTRRIGQDAVDRTDPPAIQLPRIGERQTFRPYDCLRPARSIPPDLSHTSSQRRNKERGYIIGRDKGCAIDLSLE